MFNQKSNRIQAQAREVAVLKGVIRELQQKLDNAKPQGQPIIIEKSNRDDDKEVKFFSVIFDDAGFNSFQYTRLLEILTAIAEAVNKKDDRQALIENGRRLELLSWGVRAQAAREAIKKGKKKL